MSVKGSKAFITIGLMKEVKIKVTHQKLKNEILKQDQKVDFLDQM